MAALIQAGRQFSYDVARRMGRGEGTLEASMVKAYVCRAAEWVTREAMQLHGGMGYAEEFPVSRYFVDARVLSIFEGADETLCLRVIARRLAEQALEQLEHRLGRQPPRRLGRREDVDLPIELGPCSNGEYDPVPLSPVAREAQRRARDDCDTNARRTGVSRRRFLRSLCGAATTLLAINACSEESTRHAARRRPGGTFSVPPTSAVDPDAARAALAGNEFVFDVQGHFLEYGGLDYSVEPGTVQGREFWSAFPQRDCGEADPRVCFSVDHFMEEVFLRSDTSMVALSALPIAPEGSPLSAETMDHARRLTEAVCHDQRVLLHAQALPNVGDLQANLDAMSDAVARDPIVCWKVFTNFPDLYDGSGNVWRLDDGDPSLARVGDAFLRHAVELGVPTVAAHKGLSTTLGYSSPFASPADVGPGRTRAPRRALPRVPLGLRGRRRRGPVRPGDAPTGA